MTIPSTAREHLAPTTPELALPALLAQALNNSGMSQTKLARLSRVSRPAVWKALSGKGIPSEQVTRAWDAVLGTGDSLTAQAALDRAARGYSRGGPGRPQVTVPHQLPIAPVRLVGRHQQATRIRSDLITTGVPVVVIAGAAGVGSSSLACMVAAQVRGSYPYGLLYASGHGHTPGSGPAAAGDILAEWLAALGVRAIPSNVSDRAELYRRLVRRRRLLILLDDAAGSDQVRALLPGGSGSALLVTTRHRLSSLAVSGNAALHTLTPLTDEFAREMLISRIETAQNAGGDRVSLNRVLAVCAGLPRAIAAAAELINTRGLQRTVDLLDAQPLPALDAVVHDDPGSSLAAGYQASWNCLTTPAREMLTTLAMREGWYGVNAAPDATTESARDELVREHLVSVEGWMSPLLRSWIRYHTAKAGCANHNDAA